MEFRSRSRPVIGNRTAPSTKRFEGAVFRERLIVEEVVANDGDVPVCADDWIDFAIAHAFCDAHCGNKVRADSMRTSL